MAIVPPRPTCNQAIEPRAAVDQVKATGAVGPASSFGSHCWGAKWGTLGGESIHSAPCSVIHSLAALRGAMEGSGFFAHVETIEDTSEAIFAASLLVDNSDVLVHMKMNPGDVGITVKAVTKPQSLTAIQALLAAVSF